MKYKWGDRTWEFYKPKVNRKKQGLLFTGLLLTGLIPGPNFLGIFLMKFINPGWMYT